RLGRQASPLGAARFCNGQAGWNENGLSPDELKKSRKGPSLSGGWEIKDEPEESIDVVHYRLCERVRSRAHPSRPGSWISCGGDGPPPPASRRPRRRG